MNLISCFVHILPYYPEVLWQGFVISTQLVIINKVLLIRTIHELSYIYAYNTESPEF